VLEFRADATINAAGAVDEVYGVAFVGNLHPITIRHVEAVIDQFESLVFRIDSPFVTAGTDFTIATVGSKQTKLERGATTALVFNEDLRIIENLAISENIRPTMSRDSHRRTIHHPVEKVDVMHVFLKNRPTGFFFTGTPSWPHRSTKLTTPHQLQIADITPIDHVFHVTVEPLKTHLVTDLENFPGGVGCNNDIVAFGNRQPEWLFAHDMLSRLQGSHRGGMMFVIRQSDDDGIKFIERGHVAPVGESLQSVANQFSRGRKALFATAADRCDFYTV
jgi:hypothetical protein